MNDQFAGERWLPIAGYEGRYDISDHGRVRTWIRRVGSRVVQLGEPALRVPVKGGAKGQYLKVALIIAGKSSQRYVHQLVAEHFIGPCPDGHEVAHDDGVGQHNHFGNLIWKTRSENHADKKRHGTNLEGERHPKSKLTEAQAREVLADDRRTPGPALGRRYGVGHEAIYAILNRKTWKHLTENAQ